MTGKDMLDGGKPVAQELPRVVQGAATEGMGDESMAAENSKTGSDDRSGKSAVVFDVVALVVYLVVANPAWTGVGVHEWLSLGVLVVLFVHLAMHADWVTDALKRSFSHPTAARTGNLVLDVLMLVVLVTCAVSGVMVSGAVLPTFGLVAPGYFFWDPLHAVSAKVLLALLLLHVLLHIKWFVKLFSKKGSN